MFGIPRNTISTYMKKKNIYKAEQMDKAVLKWFSLQMSQNMPLNDTIIKEIVCFKYLDENIRTLDY